MVGFTSTSTLGQWSIGLLQGGIPLLNEEVGSPSISLVTEACRAASLAHLVSQFSSMDPANRMQAAHAIAHSNRLQQSIEVHLDAPKRARVQEDAVRFGQMLGTRVPVKVLVLGDVHDRWRRVQPILDHEFPWGFGIVLSVGDLETYPLLAGGHHVYFIHGNHEDWEKIAPLHERTDPASRSYTPIFPGERVRIGALLVAGLPGVYSPHYFANPADAPPRYYTPERRDAVRSLQGPVDILLTHEAPRGVGFRKGGEDLGTGVVTEVLRALGPLLAFFGHHHLDFEHDDGDTKIIGLDYPTRSYVVLEFDPKNEAITLRREKAKLVAEGRGGYRHYQFRWERDTEDGPASERSFPLKKEERVLRILRERHLASVEDRLCQDLLTEVTGSTEADRKSQARSRAGLAIDTVLPHVARYIARLESDPNLPQKERSRLLREIHDQITSGLEVYLIPDLQKALQFFLQAWEIVVR